MTGFAKAYASLAAIVLSAVVITLCVTWFLSSFDQPTAAEVTESCAAHDGVDHVDALWATPAIEGKTFAFCRDGVVVRLR